MSYIHVNNCILNLDKSLLFSRNNIFDKMIFDPFDADKIKNILHENIGGTNAPQESNNVEENESNDEKKNDINMCNDENNKLKTLNRLQHDIIHQNNQIEEQESQSNICDLKQTDVIRNYIDINDELSFRHSPIGAWRWCNEENKWRGRGTGILKIVCNKQTELARIIFLDEKYNKIRLLQYINGKTLCEYSNYNKVSVEWYGVDYTMGLNQPMIGKWKIDFMENNY
eukprot:120521_1